MKKIIAIAACAVLAASALSACNTTDGKVGNNRDDYPYSTERDNQTTASRRVDSSRMTSSLNESHTDGGVIHDTVSMVGDVGEDIAEGVDNIGSSVESNVSDMLHDDTDTNR